MLNDADITAPSPPANLTANSISDSKIFIGWDASNDNVEVVEYLVYLDGEVEGYTRTNNYTAVFLESATDYTFTVTALDACQNESEPSITASASTQNYKSGSEVINPDGLEYLGVFKLPENFSWGGEAIAYRSTGDGGQEGGGAADGFPGSMFVTNLNQAEVGFVGEISIPAPSISAGKIIGELNEGVILQIPVNIRPDNINNWEYVDIWRTGLEYFEEENMLYSSWSIHYSVSSEKNATISVCDAGDLAGSIKYGAWYIGNPSESPIDAMMNDYMFSIPQDWADLISSGSRLVTGRFRDGGLSGLGPTMYAFQQMADSPPPANTELDYYTLLEYGSVSNSDNYNYPNSIDDYNHSDAWREATWISAEDQNAVAVIGNKALGNNWYGYHGEQMRNDWLFADVPYPEFYETDPDGKGWRAHNYKPMIILYDPSDFGDVTNGTIESFEPQPYGALRIDRNIFWGKHQEISSAGYDSENNILYVTELYPEEDGMVLIHAWQVDKIVSVKDETSLPVQFNLSQNYPNPFNPTTTIKYSLPFVERMASFATDNKNNGGQSGDWPYNVTIKVYDVLGKQVATLVNEQKRPGNYEVKWDASALTSGVYFYKLTAGGYTDVKKMLLLR